MKNILRRIKFWIRWHLAMTQEEQVKYMLMFYGTCIKKKKNNGKFIVLPPEYMINLMLDNLDKMNHGIPFKQGYMGKLEDIMKYKK